MTMDSEEKRLSSADSQKKCRCRKLPACCDPPSKLEIGVTVGSMVAYIVMGISSTVYMSVRTFDDDNQPEDIDFSPAGWAFSVWGFIYTWGFVLTGYGIAALFPRFGLHRPPMWLYPVYGGSYFCGGLWTVFADQRIYWAGQVFITGMPLTLYVCLILSIWKLRQHGLHTHHDSRKFFIYTYMVDNSIALYMGWVSVAYLLYLGLTLVNAHGADKTNVGTGCLSFLLIKLAIFLSLELTVLDKYMRHIWAHYLALINAVTGSIVQNFDPNNRNSTITVCLAGALGVAFLVKMLRIVEGKCGRPEYDGKVGPAPSTQGSAVSVGANSLPEKVDLS